MNANKSPSETSSDRRKRKILVTGAHPGDPEYGCGGTIARCAERGDEVVMIYLNRGEGGIPGRSGAEAAAIRTAEAQQAARILNTRTLFAGQYDGQSEVNRARCAEYCQILAAEQPDIVFAHWPVDNHPDHRANAILAQDAWLALEQRFVLVYYEVSNGMDTLHFSPTLRVDISAYAQRKREACFAHASQAPEMFYALQDQVCRFRGIESGCAYAEAFIRLGPGPEMFL